MSDDRAPALTTRSVVVCSEEDAVFVAPAWEKKRESIYANHPLGLRFPEVSERGAHWQPQVGLFVWSKVVFFFHAANILLFPDCGLNKNDFADS